MHIERAVSAVAEGGGGEADDQSTQIRFAQPLRDETAEDTALRFAQRVRQRIDRRRRAFAGDDEHSAMPARLRHVQEAHETMARLALAQAVQIEPRIDFDLSARDVADFSPIELRQWRRFGRTRRRG